MFRSFWASNNPRDNRDQYRNPPRQEAAQGRRQGEALTEKQKEAALENREKDLEGSQALDTSNVELTYEEKQKIMEKYDKSIEYIKSYTHQSTQLVTYFDLSTLPSDINIDNIEVIVEGDSSDNKTNK